MDKLLISRLEPVVLRRRSAGARLAAGRLLVGGGAGRASASCCAHGGPAGPRSATVPVSAALAGAAALPWSCATRTAAPDYRAVAQQIEQQHPELQRAAAHRRAAAAGRRESPGLSAAPPPRSGAGPQPRARLARGDPALARCASPRARSSRPWDCSVLALGGLRTASAGAPAGLAERRRRGDARRHEPRAGREPGRPGPLRRQPARRRHDGRAHLRLRAAVDRAGQEPGRSGLRRERAGSGPGPDLPAGVREPRHAGVQGRASSSIPAWSGRMPC